MGRTSGLTRDRASSLLLVATAGLRVPRTSGKPEVSSRNSHHIGIRPICPSVAIACHRIRLAAWAHPTRPRMPAAHRSCHLASSRGRLGHGAARFVRSWTASPQPGSAAFDRPRVEAPKNAARHLCLGSHQNEDSEMSRTKHSGEKLAPREQAARLPPGGLRTRSVSGAAKAG